MENKQSCLVPNFGLSDIFYYQKPLNGIIVYYIMTLQKSYEISLKQEQKKIPDGKTNKREKEPRINSSSSRIPKSKYSKRIGGRNRKDPVEYIYINVCVFFFPFIIVIIIIFCSLGRLQTKQLFLRIGDGKTKFFPKTSTTVYMQTYKRIIRRCFFLFTFGSMEPNKFTLFTNVNSSIYFFFLNSQMAP